jgi:hypothetical protein
MGGRRRGRRAWLALRGEGLLSSIDNDRWPLRAWDREKMMRTSVHIGAPCENEDMYFCILLYQNISCIFYQRHPRHSSSRHPNREDRGKGALRNHHHKHLHVHHTTISCPTTRHDNTCHVKQKIPGLLSSTKRHAAVGG